MPSRPYGAPRWQHTKNWRSVQYTEASTKRLIVSVLNFYHSTVIEYASSVGSYHIFGLPYVHITLNFSVKFTEPCLLFNPLVAVTKETACNKRPALLIFFFLWRCGPTRAIASSFLKFLDHTQRRNTVGRTPLDEWSVRRRDLYLTTHNTHNRQTSMPPVEFKPKISASERPQTYALDRAATRTGVY